jgi:L-ascorbate metabolism protein UlaG (beta-lactamase superfamily)
MADTAEEHRLDIRWLAEGCVELRTAGAAVLIDPPPVPTAGVAAAAERADVVTVSRRAMLPAGVHAGRWIDGPGEYEKAGVFVIGVRTLPARLGPLDERQVNTAYVYTADDVTVCHLGATDHVPSESELEALGRIDVLLLPIGGAGRLPPAKAAEIVGKLEPGIVIPVHAALPLDDPPPPEREALAHFLAAMGASDVVAQDSYRVAVDRLADDTTVVLLRPIQP